MSVQPAPNCGTPVPCAGFNESCFQPSGGGSLSNDYVHFPLAQGVVTYPNGLTTEADIAVNGDAVLTGINGVVYQQYPDGTRQYVPYKSPYQGSTSFSFATLGYTQTSTFLLSPIQISYATGVTSFSASVWSGAGTTTLPVSINPAVPIVAQPFSITTAGTSGSGSGVGVFGLPVAAGTTNAVQAVFLPNLSSTGTNVGTASITVNWAAQQLTFTTYSGPALTTNMQLVLTTPKFGSPRSFVLGNQISTGTFGGTWSFISGISSTNSSFFVAQTTPLAVTVYNQTNTIFTGSFSVTNNILTVSTSTFQGDLTGLLMITPNFSCLVTNKISSITYGVSGVASTFTGTASSAVGFYNKTGFDVALSIYSSSTTPTPIAYVSGGSCSNSINAGQAGSITMFSQTNSATQYAGVAGLPGVRQSTLTYPTGLTTYSSGTSSNPGAVFNGLSSVVKTCANSNSYTVSFNAYNLSNILAGNGGIQVLFE